MVVLATVTLTAAGLSPLTVVVNQAAGDVISSISKDSVDFGKTGGNTTVDVTCNTSWTVSSDQAWVSVSPTISTTGNGTLEITAVANTDTARIATVTVNIDGGTSRTIIVTQASGTSTSINESSKYRFRLYPNPCSDILYVEGVTQTAELIITDLKGNQISKEELANKQAISVSFLPKGNYLATITNNGISETYIFIKK